MYPGSRRWLPMNHAWRKQGHLFDGTDEIRGIPEQRNGTVIDELLRNWKECPAAGKNKKKTEPLLRVWKVRSVFWDLPYWKLLRVIHSLDLMHITKNVCESLLATILNMPDKTKDGPKARNDLKHMGIRKDLQPPPSDDDQSTSEEGEEETQNSRRKGKKVKKAEVKLAPRASL